MERVGWSWQCIEGWETKGGEERKYEKRGDGIVEGKSSVKEDEGAGVQVEEEAFFAGTWVLDVCKLELCILNLLPETAYYTVYW